MNQQFTEEQHLENTISLYNNQAEVFSTNVKDVDVMMPVYNSLFSFEPGRKILDIGSGSGRDMLYFHSKGYEVQGVEISQGLVDLYPKDIKDRVICDDMRNIDTLFQDQYFNVIWGIAAIVHMCKEWGYEIIKKASNLQGKEDIFVLGVKHWNQDDNAPEEILKESNTIPGVVKRYVYWHEDELIPFFEDLGYTLLEKSFNKRKGSDLQMVLIFRKN